MERLARSWGDGFPLGRSTKSQDASRPPVPTNQAETYHKFILELQYIIFAIFIQRIVVYDIRF